MSSEARKKYGELIDKYEKEMAEREEKEETGAGLTEEGRKILKELKSKKRKTAPIEKARIAVKSGRMKKEDLYKLVRRKG